MSQLADAVAYPELVSRGVVPTDNVINARYCNNCR